MGWRAAALALLVSSALGVAAAPGGGDESLRVSSVAGAAGGAPWRWAAGAAELAARALSAGGAGARVAEPHPALRAACGAPDSRRCLRGTLETLREWGGVELAAVAAAGAGGRLAQALRDAGLVDLGDVAPPARRELLAAGGAARSLEDLAEPEHAQLYELADDELRELGVAEDDIIENGCPAGPSCATVLAESAAEARVLARALSARVAPLAGGIGARLPHLAVLAARRPLLLATWSTQRAALQRALPAARPLLVPACAAPPDTEPEDLANDDRVDCPFEERRLVKLADGYSAARLAAELRALSILYLSADDVDELGAEDTAQAAATSWAARHEARMERWRAAAESRAARVLALVPRSGPRRAYDGAALAAAAELAAEDARADPAAQLQFFVSVQDAACSAPLAFRAATGALSSGEYSMLSALAGPACSAALGSVATLGPVLRLPVLAYTTATAPSDAAGWLVLAAGDARHRRAATADAVALFGWKRAALLAEVGAVDAVAASGELALVHRAEVEASASSAALAAAAQLWAEGAAAAGARVLLVAAEDGRVARAALCAGRAAGLGAGPGAGAPEDAAHVWFLSTWPAPPPGLGQEHKDTTCTDDELDEMADGHLSIMEEWEWRWLSGSGNGTAEREWRSRWAARGGGLGAPPPHAALLHDVLALWRGALAALLAARPAALRDLHDPFATDYLMRHITAASRAPLTGRLRWQALPSAGGAGNVTARRSALVLTQWARSGNARTLLARYEDGRWWLEREPAWNTVDSARPDDGSERCALGGLARLLGGDCRAAGVALAAGVLAALAAGAAAAAWRGKRRAEKRCRAVAMRELRKPPPLDRWELPRERVVINRRLGVGQFGAVYGGHALLGDAGWTPVAVKTLKPGADTADKLEFLSEAETMKRFEHKNIVRLLGVVTATEPACTVMEYMLHGDLKSYLLARRHLAAPAAHGAAAAAGDEADDVAPRRLTAMARDAARALSYLAEQRYVHRDVAARNCLVSARRVLKLADFGMARSVFDSDYYRFGRKGMLPVRWMAPESVALGVFSAASDVWSLGVLLYETATLGALPHQGLSNRQVLAAVKAGGSPGAPAGASPRLAALLAACWQVRPEARPAASEVAALLGDAPRLVAPCVEAGALPPGAPLPSRPQRLSWPPASDATEATYLSAEPPTPPPPPPADAARPEDPLLPL